MRLNWFSPLPPARPRVTDFTVGILPALAPRFDVILLTETSGYNREIARHAAVRLFSNVRATDCDPDAINVFNIGNDLTLYLVTREKQS